MILIGMVKCSHNISKKKLWIEFIFCMYVNMKVGVIVFDGSGQAGRKLVIFL